MHKLVLVGKSMGLSATAKHAIVKSTYKEDILSTGYIPDERLVLLLSGAEALINLSDYEGFGMPIVEAMACAVPVIAADKSCFPEICGDAALFVEPHDSSQVSHGMEKCLKERDEWVIRVGHRLKSFNWDGSAHKVSVMINTLKVS